MTNISLKEFMLAVLVGMLFGFAAGAHAHYQMGYRDGYIHAPLDKVCRGVNK